MLDNYNPAKARYLPKIWNLFLFTAISSLIEFDGNADESKYINASLKIIEAINNNSDSMIPLSPEWKKIIDKYGYEKFLMYYKSKLGRINSWGSPVFFHNTAKFQITAEKGRWSLIVKILDDGSISLFKFIEPDPIVPVPLRNMKRMQLPFHEEWAVVEGGSTVEQNYHMGLNKNSYHSVDFVFRNEEGSSHKLDGAKNEEFYGYGKDILAVGDGEIVAVINGVPDNRPFTVNLSATIGNSVIIKHSENEFSMYCHLKLNSPCVKVGQKILCGQVIGQCGNSGYSTSPHLHFQLANAETLADATGFPPFFDDVIVTRKDSKTILNEYSPLKGDRVRNKINETRHSTR